MKNLKKGFAVPIIIVIVVLLILGVGIYIYTKTKVEAPIVPSDNINDDMVICAMDAMECPDGSWVGRTGPNCEFVCPTL